MYILDIDQAIARAFSELEGDKYTSTYTFDIDHALQVQMEVVVEVFPEHYTESKEDRIYRKMAEIADNSDSPVVEITEYLQVKENFPLETAQKIAEMQMTVFQDCPTFFMDNLIFEHYSKLRKLYVNKPSMVEIKMKLKFNQLHRPTSRTWERFQQELPKYMKVNSLTYL